MYHSTTITGWGLGGGGRLRNRSGCSESLGLDASERKALSLQLVEAGFMDTLSLVMVMISPTNGSGKNHQPIPRLGRVNSYPEIELWKEVACKTPQYQSREPLVRWIIGSRTACRTSVISKINPTSLSNQICISN